jgi:two-component system, LytTR family, response regulator
LTARTLIVDDEPHARARIRRLLRHENGVEVVGECESGDEVAEAIRTLHPDLLFLDVQIRGATAFDVIGELGAENMPVTVFVTAYGEHAIAAFDVEAADYLLKPFDRERFRRALARSMARITERKRAESARSEPRAEPEPLDWFLLRGADRELRLLRAEDVDLIEASGNYVFLYTRTERHLYRETMASLEDRLDGRRFVRVHRSAIVNVEAIVSLEPIAAGDYELHLRGDRHVRMSRNFRDALERLTGRPG